MCPRISSLWSSMQRDKTSDIGSELLHDASLPLGHFFGAGPCRRFDALWSEVFHSKVVSRMLQSIGGFVAPFF